MLAESLADFAALLAHHRSHPVVSSWRTPVGIRKVLTRELVGKAVGFCRHRDVTIYRRAAVASLMVLVGVTGCAANRVATNAERCFARPSVVALLVTIPHKLCGTDQ